MWLVGRGLLPSSVRALKLRADLAGELFQRIGTGEN